jgi:hypothetical protein
MRWVSAAIVVTLFLFGPMSGRSIPEESGMAGPAQVIPPDLDTGREALSEGGNYRVGYRVAGGVVPFDRLHDWLLSITDKNGKPVEKVRLEIANSMPGHPHGAKTAPRMTRHIKGGKHLVEGMYFNMRGWWSTKITIKQGDLTDRVEFNNIVK